MYLPLPIYKALPYVYLIISAIVIFADIAPPFDKLATISVWCLTLAAVLIIKLRHNKPVVIKKRAYR
jgi:hypothetical protein